MKYVNAYIVTRHYGGPEEGGWWFNAGEPLASVPVSDNGDPEVIREDLRVKFADLNRGEHLLGPRWRRSGGLHRRRVRYLLSERAAAL
jgi:hypothetical protein